MARTQQEDPLLTLAWSACCVQNGLEKKVEKSRKQKKERRRRTNKIRGVKKSSEYGATCLDGGLTRVMTRTQLVAWSVRRACMHSRALRR